MKELDSGGSADFGIEELCRDINDQTEEFYRRIQPRMKSNLGYEILYGPPHFRPPVLFIGYQPGGDENSVEKGIALRERKGWPEACTYATESWRLATTMQRMFGKDYLLQCVGLNAIFLRAPSVTQYRQNVGPVLEREIEEFCKAHLETIIHPLQTQPIVLISLPTAPFFGEFQPDLKRRRQHNHNLTMTGFIGGYAALSVLHLSGARISNEELQDIKDRIINMGHAQD
jgi:hypothetical protein